MTVPDASDPNDYVWIAPCRKGGQPCVGGTRLPALLVAEYVWDDTSVEHVAREYSITRVQALVACWYVATYGSRSWRKRWGAWAKRAHPFLWDRAQHADCPPPPQKSADA